MKTYTPLFLFAALGLLSISGTAAAAADTSNWKCTSCPYPKSMTGNVEAGLGTVSEDSKKFGDFTGLDEFNNGKGTIDSDKNYKVKDQPGFFVGGDVVRPHLLTTAIGHGAIAAEGIDRFLQGEPLEKRPKIDVHTFDLQRKMLEKGLAFSEVHEPIRGTDKSTAAIHNFDNRSDRYVISHKELFLGHFPYLSRNMRGTVTLTAEQALNNTKEQFANSPDLANEILNAVMDALTAHSVMSRQALESDALRRDMKDVLLGPGRLWEGLRERASSLGS